MYDSITDIWQGVLNKDPASWSRLVHRLSPLVYTVAARSGLNETEVDDCAQQTWLALFQSRHKIKDPLSVPAWLIRVASRTAVRMNRNKEALAGTTQPEGGTPAVNPPSEELEMIEAAAILEQGLEMLDKRCRLLLEAIFLAPEKTKYRDIARQLGLPLNSLGPTRSRCLKKLRLIMEELGYR